MTDRGWLSSEARSRAGTFPLCTLHPLSCGTQQGPMTHAHLPAWKSLTSLHRKGDILAQITIVKQLLCPRDCAHILSTFSCFILTTQSEVGTIFHLCFHSRTLRRREV